MSQARTAAGSALTIQHRQSQMQIRAAAMRDFTQIWPLWRGDRSSFQRLVEATLPLVAAHRRISAALAAAYYEAFRKAEKIPGASAVRIAPAAEARGIIASMYVTGSVMTGKALDAGLSAQAAMQTALVRTSGAVGRHALAGGRETLVLSSQADRRSSGLYRIIANGACDFCTQFEGQITTGDFQAHDHCSCSAEPAY